MGCDVMRCDGSKQAVVFVVQCNIALSLIQSDGVGVGVLCFCLYVLLCVSERINQSIISSVYRSIHTVFNTS